MEFHPIRWVGRRVRAVLGYLASRSVHPPFEAGASDLQKAATNSATFGALLLAGLSFLADHAGDLPNYFHDPKVVAAVGAGLIFAHRLLTLFVQGQAVSINPGDPTAAASEPKPDPPA